MKKIQLCLIGLILFLDSKAQNWEVMEDVPVNLAFPVVVELNGYIHVMGGGTGQGATGFHTRFDPATNSWETLADVPYLAQQPAGAVVNGMIHYCGGGYPNSGTPLDDHYYYDVTLDQWFESEPLPTARVIHEAVELNGKLYVLTGQPDKQRFDVYDPSTGLWTQLNDLPDLNFWYGAIVATNNTIYRFGGGGYTAPQEVAHQYDVAEDEWIPVQDLPTALHAPAGVVINDQLILISGGYNVSEQDASWLYHTGTDTYIPSDAFPMPRSYHAMALANGCVYSVGGHNLNNDTIGVDMLQNCEIFATGLSPLNKLDDKPYEILFTEDYAEISFSGSLIPHSVGYQLIDMSGKTIMQDILYNIPGTIRIPCGKLNSGTYLMIISTGEKFYIENWSKLK